MNLYHTVTYELYEWYFSYFRGLGGPLPLGSSLKAVNQKYAMALTTRS